MTVYIQKRNLDKPENTYQFDGCYAAHEGAEHRGLKVIMFEDIMEVPARRYKSYTSDGNILVVACIEDTEKYLERLGVEIPKSINVPQFLIDRKYVNRKLSYMTLNEFKTFELDKPMFVKPLYKVKAFPSGVNTQRNMLPILLSDYTGSWDIPVLVSEVVDMVSEYRVYVSKNRGQIIGMRHYQGNEMLFPDVEHIRMVVNELCNSGEMPATFSADFAVIKNHSYHDRSNYGNYRTELIEVQDAWAIGAYGLDGNKYLSFLMERWAELTK